MNESVRENPKEIIKQLHQLLDRLAVALGDVTPTSYRSAPAKKQQSATEKFSTPAGGVRLLLKEGFFSELKTMSEVIERLQHEGFDYRKNSQVISVALLRLVRARDMKRLPIGGEGKERWTYQERK